MREPEFAGVLEYERTIRLVRMLVEAQTGGP
jgi:hypothetical protein